MLDELEANLPDFGGTAAHTRCFLHTVNLVAKSLIKEFDVSKKDKEALQTDEDATSDEDEHLAQELADLSREAEVEGHDDAPLDEQADNVEGLVDEMALLTEGEHNKLQRSIRPVKLVLVKVSYEVCCKRHNHLPHYAAPQTVQQSNPLHNETSPCLAQYP